MLQALLTIFLLAIAVEGIIEYLATPAPSWLKPPLAAALAIFLCLAWRADLLAALGFPAAVPYAGSILTGAIIGRGSNYLAIYLKQARSGSSLLLDLASPDTSGTAVAAISSSDTAVADTPASAPMPLESVAVATSSTQAATPTEMS